MALIISLYSQKASIEDKTLLTGRLYSGTAIFIRKDIKCTKSYCDGDCDRLCAIMADFGNYTVLFNCFHMSCDSSNNCDSLNPNVSGGGQKSTTPSNYQHRIFPFNYIIVRFR